MLNAKERDVLTRAVMRERAATVSHRQAAARDFMPHDEADARIEALDRMLRELAVDGEINFTLARIPKAQREERPAGVL